MRKRSKARSFLFALITVGLSVTFSFALLEVAAAKFLLGDMEAVRKEFDPVLGWRYAPGEYKVKRTNSLVPHQIEVNRFGLRVSEFDPTLEGRATRIVVLGDSFTFAVAVSQEHIYTSQLARRLNEHQPGSYEVVNAGVEGYGTGQQLLLARLLAEENIVGDVYVLQLFTNDILDNLRLDYASKALNPLKPGFVLDDERLPVLVNPPEPREEKLNRGVRKKDKARIYTVIRDILETQVQSSPKLIELATNIGINIEFPRMPGIVNAWYDDEIVDRGVPLMKELIRQIDVEVRERDAKLLVMFIPSPLMVYPDTYGPLLKRTFPSDQRIDALVSDLAKSQRIINEICREIDVPLLDMYPTLLQQNDVALYFPREGHLTAEGHAVVAGSLAKMLTDEYLP